MKPIAAFFWRKLDNPGHDSCRLFKLSHGWRISGSAVFWDSGRPCHFQYDVITDAGWRTERANVEGFLGKRAIHLHVNSAGGGRWRISGKPQNNVTGCVDVDFGFTPATNLIVLRRLSLKVGQRADAPAVYLEFPQMRFVKLPQTYVRIGLTKYKYEAPTVGYSGILNVNRGGVITKYPGLFERVTSGKTAS
jgi:hypothetical protein